MSKVYIYTKGSIISNHKHSLATSLWELRPYNSLAIRVLLGYSTEEHWEIIIPSDKLTWPWTIPMISPCLLENTI